jgi:hypothetical protein
MSNLGDDEKMERIEKSMAHLTNVKVERNVYNESIERSRTSFNNHPTKKLSNYEPCTFNGDTHISFDYAQQVHIPNLPDQPGPIYFLTPYKLGIFGIQNEAAHVQVNFVIPEAVQTGKGANTVISYVHYYLKNYNLGEKELFIHADNCVGQNKNNKVMAYLCWRVIVGLNQKIVISFLPVGHTKFSPDGGFGVIKSKFRRTEICTAQEFAQSIEDSTPITKLNKAVVVGSELGDVYIQSFDWNTKFSEWKTIPNLKKFHHFVFSSDKPGEVQCREFSGSNEITFTLLVDIEQTDNSEPAVLQPVGLNPDRQWYLFEKIRDLVPSRAQEVICPKPQCRRHTFAETRKEQSTSKRKKTEMSDSESEDVPIVLPLSKRKPQTCSFCGETGHINRVIRGQPACPKRKADPNASPTKL